MRGKSDCERREGYATFERFLESQRQLHEPLLREIIGTSGALDGESRVFFFFFFGKVREG